MEKFPMEEHQPLPESQWDEMAGFANWRTEELEREAQKEYERRERWRAELREEGLIDSGSCPTRASGPFSTRQR